MTSTTESTPRHRRNARGQGNRLAEEIVRGALAIVERTGSDDAVTLRAVAREVGIAAPSIYAHFADREAIIMAAVVQIFDELADAVEQAEAAAVPDPALTRTRKSSSSSGRPSASRSGLSWPSR